MKTSWPKFLKSKKLLIVCAALAVNICFAQTMTEFMSDGELGLSSDLVGKKVRIIAIGGGGGGSGATAQAHTLRSGAGGGSGGVNILEFDFTPANIGKATWSVGSGGKAGEGYFAGVPQPATFSSHGAPGNATKVNVPGMAELVASGGEGGTDVRSGYISFGAYLIPLPPIGGSGGVPWGQSGANGVATQTVDTRDQPILGGAPGALSETPIGAGGVGGGTNSSRQLPANWEVVPSSGNPGTAGRVLIQIGETLPPVPSYLQRSQGPAVVNLTKGDNQAVDGFIARIKALCGQDAQRCPAEEASKIDAVQANTALSPAAKFLALTSGTGGSLPQWVWNFFKEKIPSPQAVIWDVIWSIPGDAPRPKPIVFDARLAGKTDGELNEMFGLYTVALINLNQAPSTQATREAILNIQEMRQAIQETLIKREMMNKGSTPTGLPSLPSGTGGPNIDPYVRPRDWLRDNQDKVGSEYETCMRCASSGNDVCVVSICP
nr:hypothetical protein [uncultured Albidiferax sp.]